MKPILIAAAVFAISATASFAEPLLGTWQTGKDDNGNYGHIAVSQCGAKLCGVLAKSFNSAGKQWSSPNDGKRIIWDMSPNGGGKYSGGKVWAPDRDKTYNSKIQVSGNSLTVQGCVLGICRDGGTWSRVN